MQGLKPYTIGFVTDPSLSRERTQIALRAVNMLREIADVRFFPGNLTEDDLLKRVTNEHLDLLLVPWHQYLHLQRIEAHFGLTRVSGPTLIGYFAEDVSPNEILEEDYHFRAIFIDLNRLSSHESADLLKLFLRDATRWGIKPLALPSTLVHYETWTAQVGIGFRVDTLLSLPEVANTNWVKRSNSIRILLSALWSMIFDHGPGKRDHLKSNDERTNRAYFEFAADSKALFFRLCYSEPGWKVKDVLHQFWPGAMAPSHAGQVLFHFSDILRVHVDPETSEMEITCMLTPTAPSDRAMDILKTIWIEPLTSATRLERNYESEATMELYHRPLVTHHALIGNAVDKIEELKKQIYDRDEKIKHISSKGVSQETVFVYPNGLDSDQIIHLFMKRLHESRTKLKLLHDQLALVRGTSPDEVREANRIIREIRDLSATQKGWIHKLKTLLSSFHAQQDRESANGDADFSSADPNEANAEPATPLSEEEEALAVVGTVTREKRDTKRSTSKRGKKIA